MAVYTRLDKKEISDHLLNYNIGSLQSYKEIVAGIDNSNFIIKTTTGKYILTIFEARIKSEDLPIFINFKSHLSQKNICCPKPILSNNQLSINDLKNKKSAIVTFLEGKTLEPQENGYYNNITEKHCYEVGKILAQLHLASQDFKESRFNDLGVYGFEKLFDKFDHLLNNYQAGLKEEILQTIKYIKDNWQDDLPKTMCHLDLFPDNVFFDEKQNLSGVIDFYFSASDLLIYDFAIIANAWCFDENNNFCQEKYSQMLAGYQETRKFNEQELIFLKTALICASTRFLLTRLHDMFFTPKDSLVKIKNPQEYLAKLRYFRDKYDN